jgi:hypothetical protein
MGRLMATTPGPPVEVFELTEEEWQEAAERGLTRVGLTYNQLAAQATAGRFQNVEARKLWYAIGGNYRPACCDSHNEHCEPPADLCCDRCSEAAHDTFPVRHADGSPCVMKDNE